MIHFSRRAVAGSCLGSVVGGTLGVIAGVTIGWYTAGSTMNDGREVPILGIFFLLHAVVEFGIAAIAGGAIGAVLGGMLGTAASTATLRKSAEAACAKADESPVAPHANEQLNPPS